MTPPHVIVIGGGLAGLSCALGLQDGGAAVTLLEARPRLGGATWSFRRHGLTFDNGQHVYLRCCTAYRRFLERVGTIDDAPLQDRLDLAVLRPRPGREAAVAHLRERSLPAPLQLAPALLGYRHLALAQRFGLGRAALALLRARTTDANLDAESFASFLARYGQGGEATRALFELIALPTTNVHLDEASAALVTKVFRTGLLGEPGASAIGWARIPLGALHGDAAERALVAGGATIRRRAKVSAIDVASDGEVARAPGAASAGDGARPHATGVVVDGEHLDADAVVLAVPHEDAAELLPESVGFAPALAGLGTSPIVDIHLIFDRKITEHAVAAGVDTPVQFLFDRTAACGLEGPGQCLAISVSGADAEHGMRSADLIERYHQAIVELFPAAREAALLDAVVSREHTATFRGRPGTAALRPGAETGVGGLYLAGAWTDTGWPATMEGAVRSGTKAAWHALGAVGLSGLRPAPLLAEVAA
jgi:squalene-associated FAD-dependent desaturase